jgi:hypothetical protein
MYPKKPILTIPFESIKKIKKLKEKPCLSKKDYVMI